MNKQTNKQKRKKEYKKEREREIFYLNSKIPSIIKYNWFTWKSRTYILQEN